MLKKDAREPYKENGVAQCFQGLRRFCFQTRDCIIQHIVQNHNNVSQEVARHISPTFLRIFHRNLSKS